MQMISRKRGNNDSASLWICPECRQSLSAATNKYYCAQCEFTVTNLSGIWSSDQSFVPDGFSHASRVHLHELENHHFWFKPRSRLFQHILLRCVPTRFQASIELGCGNGLFLEFLARISDRVVGVEGHLPSLAFARKLSTTATLLHGDLSRVPIQNGMFDLACAFDVLEHVPPNPFLLEIRRLLRPDGLLLLSVPAFQSLWSRVDERAGHRCRYHVAQVEAELQTAGFQVVSYTHYQFLLFPLVWLSRRLGSKQGRSHMEAMPSLLISRFLGAVNSFEVAMFSKVSLPFGSSLVLLAKAS